jgi:hypothetical protein
MKDNNSSSVPNPPSVEEIVALAEEFLNRNRSSLQDFAYALLSRWGQNSSRVSTEDPTDELLELWRQKAISEYHSSSYEIPVSRSMALQAINWCRQQTQPLPKQERTDLDLINQAIEKRDEIEQRYHDLAQNMVYEGNSVAHWCNKARAYKSAISEVWEELKKAGITPDGYKSSADGIRELAERFSSTEKASQEEVAKVIYWETYYAFGFDSFPPKWEDLEDCLIKHCCRDAAHVILTRWALN